MLLDYLIKKATGKTTLSHAKDIISTVSEHTPGGSLQKSFVDNVFRHKVTPIKGSILHCSLFGAEHTGVYIGNNQIVELLGTGEIRIATPAMFTEGTNAISIYVACNDKEPLGGKNISQRANSKASTRRDYHLLKPASESIFLDKTSIYY